MALTEARSSAPTGSGPNEAAPDPRLMHRIRLSAVCVLLTALAFVQEPGRIVADTKLDLANDPAGFLGRSLHLWEPLGFFGQLQNQAYGYLFPVGPFFVVGDLIGLEPWVVQRLWWSVILVAAFLGVVRLSRMLGVTSPIAGILAGLGYALAPRMVTEIGVVSVEVLPFAVAPWVAIPLVAAAQGRIGPRRAAALSGLAVLCASGVNAVATIAVLPVGAWWILTAFRGRARLAIAGWWALAVTLACMWWAVPLLILGQYSPPFLDWIESSSVTTLITSPDTVLRGASQWVAYVADAGGPVWPAGWQLVTSPFLVLATACVAALGLAGLALRGAPHRGYLLGLVLMGFVLVSLGHMGDVDGFGAAWIREVLDGPLAPFRNTHKFDLLLRLPIAVGVGLCAQAIINRGAQRDGREAASRAAIGGLAALVVLSAWPLITGSAGRDRSYAEIPDYWGQAADWLANADPAGRALVVPGSSFGVYLWGRTQDEPLQVLASTPWAVRDAVPLSSAGNIRWLDAVQERLDSGRGSPGLADALARAGVRYVVVRNDIDPSRAETPRTALIRQALVRSGGFLPVAGLGPPLSPYRTDGTVIDRGLQDTTAAVEIWRVESDYAPEDARVWLRDAGAVLSVSGASESVIDMTDAGVVGSAAVVMSGDEGALADAAGVTLLGGVTDGYLRTEVGVGRSRDNRSEAMTADQEFRQSRRVHDFYPVDPAGRQAVAEFRGGTVSASSSGSDPTAVRSREPSAQAWSALDGDPATAWLSGDLDAGVGQWWEVVTDEEFEAASIPVRFLVGIEAGAFPSEVTVTTDSGEVTTAVDATLPIVDLPLPAGPTKRLRITLTSVADGSDGDAFGLREVGIPVDIVRTVQTVGAADGGPIVLTARRGEQSSCVSVAARLVCSTVLGKVGEERVGIRRVISVAETGTYRVSVWGRPRPGQALDAQLTPFDGGALTATASSVATSDPASRAQSAVDGVASTAWVAAPLDERPELVLTWGTPVKVSGIKVELSPDLPVSRPLTMSVFANGTQTTGVVSGTGIVSIPPQVTTTLRLRFDNSVAVRSLDPASGFYATLPLGVSDIRVLGGQDVPTGPLLIDQVVIPCGFGPELKVDGVPALETTVTTVVSDVLTDSRLSATPCEGPTLRLDAGQHEIEVMSTEEFVVDSVAFNPVGALDITDEPVAPTILEWGDTYRTVEIDAATEPQLLETSENANVGWVATIDGEELERVRVDGWRQAWLVPAGSGGLVVLEFVPDGAFRTALLIGLLAAAALVVLAVVGRREDASRAVGAQSGVDSMVGDRRRRVPSPSAWILAASAVVCAALVGGWWGLGAGAVAVALAYVLNRCAVTLAFGAACALLAAAMPWPMSREAPAWLVVAAALAAIAAIASAAAPARRARQTLSSDGGGDAPMLEEDVRR